MTNEAKVKLGKIVGSPQSAVGRGLRLSASIGEPNEAKVNLDNMTVEKAGNLCRVPGASASWRWTSAAQIGNQKYSKRTQSESGQFESGPCLDRLTALMSTEARNSLKLVRTMVVKLGTQLLNDRERRLDQGYLNGVALQIAQLRERGVRVTVVSSGAIGCGLRELNLAKRPTDLAKLQATAAVGQRKLMDAWADAFEAHKLPVAQLLLTREDVDERTRFLNVRNTIAAAHELGAIPIINENDTISTDEIIKITFGDNDLLGAAVASAMRADLLVLLTVVDGVLDREGKSVRTVANLDDARALLRSEKSALGKGGMSSKLEAARMMMDAGECLIVANGRMENVLVRIVEGDEVGTLFVPAHRKRSSRSRWIGTARPVGTIIVDDGASKALVEKNKSLLPAGIVKVSGEFERGDVIAISTKDNTVIARGLSNYPSEVIEKIRGKKTSEVRAMLAEEAYDEVVHRDNLVIV